MPNISNAGIYGNRPVLIGTTEVTNAQYEQVALSCLEVCSDFMAEPFHRLGQAQRRLIREHLVELNLPLDLRIGG